MPGRILRLCKNFPASTSPLTQMARGIRCFVCYPIFDHCGKNVNIERGANFSMGGDFNRLWQWSWHQLR